MQALNTEDMLELNLRRLGAYVYESRTKDSRGAAFMLAVAPPGAGTDIAPTWLVADATVHSKTEHQRDERVRYRPGGGGHYTAEDGEGGGRGGKGKKGKGKKGRKGDSPAK